MSTTAILFFECWGKLGKWSESPMGVFMAVRTAEIMAEQVERFKFDTCEPLTEAQLLARLDPTVGPKCVQLAVDRLERSVNATVAVVEFI